jgi:hypothetical protein
MSLIKCEWETFLSILTLAADAYLPIGQFLLKDPTLNIEDSLRYGIETRRWSFQNRIIIIQINYLFVYLRVLNFWVRSQLQSQREYKTTETIRQTQGQNQQTKKEENLNKWKLFKCKHKSMSIDLQIALASDAQPTEGQWLEEQQNLEKWRTFGAWTRIPTVSSF